jgi:hypothetical protein
MMTQPVLQRFRKIIGDLRDVRFAPKADTC